MKGPTRAGLTNPIADMKWVVTSLILVFLSCNGQKKNAMVTAVSDAQDADTLLSLIASDSYSGADSPETLLITDTKSLQKFYSKINRTRKPGLPVPDIDFSKERVIIRCSGKQDDTSIPELYLMEDSGDTLIVGIKSSGKKATSSAVTTPFSIYKMPLTQKEIIFKEE